MPRMAEALKVKPPSRSRATGSEQEEGQDGDDGEQIDVVQRALRAPASIRIGCLFMLHTPTSNGPCSMRMPRL